MRMRSLRGAAKRCVLPCAGLLLVLLAGGARADLYRELVKGDAAQRSEAALTYLREPHEHHRGILQRAIHVAAQAPLAQHLPHLAGIVADGTLDTPTRAAAALALGVIGRGHPTLWPPGHGDPGVHRPLPTFAKHALLDCAQQEGASMLRSACAEALGVAGVSDAVDVLAPIAASDEDPVARVFAGRALTRLTGVFSIPAGAIADLLGMVTP